MSRTTRTQVFDPHEIGVYHVYNRVVRRCFLCGKGPVSGKDFSYRRSMIVNRLRLLARHFAVDVLGYAVLSNHFHLVVRNRPDQVAQWDDREVARRWCGICPEKRLPDGTPVEPSEARLTHLLADKPKIAELRRRLSNPSWLMRLACQYIARRCNAEDEQSGHFFEERFKMKRLLDEAAVLACLAYVDLNPLRAGLTDSLEGYAEVSIGERLRCLDESGVEPQGWLAPLSLETETNRQPVQVADLSSSSKDQSDRIDKSVPKAKPERLGCLPIDLDLYVDLLRWLAIRSRPELAGRLQATDASTSAGVQACSGDGTLRKLGLDAEAFADVIESYERRFFTVVGCPARVREEAQRRQRRWLCSPGRHALARTPSKPLPR